MNIKIDANVCRACLQTGSGESLVSDTDLREKFQFVTDQVVSTKHKFVVVVDQPFLVAYHFQNLLQFFQTDIYLTVF